ncbi:recombinase family protein [Brevundimonas vancanneytii]|uniref:recombinase family protein n=1 Tax=Brevundimonas vancanneytii TaxID=1325724 RepID=UPI0033BC04F7
MQNPRSTQDQIQALRVVSEACGKASIRTFTDEAVSGSALVNRPGLQALLVAVARGEIDKVRAESLDRLSRDQEDIAHIYKRLQFAGVALETLSEGHVTELHIGLKGTMNQMFLTELGNKTRRGLVARVKDGFSGGGRCFGYDLAAKGELTINTDQARVVRSIFERYAEGESPRAIAHSLNATGVPGPRGGTWTPSTINGDRRAQDGILHQELYAGVRVFNRRKFRKHPDTGRRSSVLNPPEDWIREPVPDLRIIDDDLWARVQNRKAALSALPAAHARKPKRLLSGLMKCDRCGAAMILNGGKYICSANRDRGTCANGKIIAARAVERRVLDGVKTHLISPEAIALAVARYQEAAEEHRRMIERERAPMEKELAEIARRLERAQVMFMEEVIDLETLKARTAPLKAQQVELTGLLSEVAPTETVRLHPGITQAYRRLTEDLHLAIEGDAGEDLRKELRRLIDRVDFIPLDGLGKFDLRVHGSLAVLLGLGGTQKAENPTVGDCGVSLGAGAGFEPATFRL